MRHEGLTGKILGACFDVANGLGPGFLESVYRNALLICLREHGLTAKAEVPLEVRFHGQVVGEFVADVVVGDQIVLELKAVRALTPEHQAQLVNYLNATGLGIGLLINFGAPRLEYKRCHRRGLAEEGPG